MENKQRKSKSTYGIIALAIAILSMFVPKIFLTLVLILIAIFMILGFINDRLKIYSLIALIIVGFIIFSMFKESAMGAIDYIVTYEVVCEDCDVSFANETGGTDKIENVRGAWQKKITLSGNDFIYLTAQNSTTERDIIVRVYVNGILFQEEKSSGRFAIANVSGRPKGIN